MSAQESALSAGPALAAAANDAPAAALEASSSAAIGASAAVGRAGAAAGELAGTVASGEVPTAGDVHDSFEVKEKKNRRGECHTRNNPRPKGAAPFFPCLGPEVSRVR